MGKPVYALNPIVMVGLVFGFVGGTMIMVYE
jgi:hypothetical protein